MTASQHTVRVASVQFAARQTDSPDAFFDRIATYVRSAGDYGADFVCFPEHFTLQLLSGASSMVPAGEAIDRLSEYTPLLKERLAALAREHDVNIIGGSHATIFEGEAHNITFVALRDGTLHARHKLHPTPDEKAVWNIRGGASAEPVETDRGPVGVMICYDSEFPEMGRHLTDAGASLFFVPYCTDTRHGHLRVRYCCHARTVENQCYVVTSRPRGHGAECRQYGYQFRAVGGAYAVGSPLRARRDRGRGDRECRDDDRRRSRSRPARNRAGARFRSQSA
jgi:predicted amidohydrolase